MVIYKAKMKVKNKPVSLKKFDIKKISEPRMIVTINAECDIGATIKFYKLIEKICRKKMSGI